jgi:hypothetical protein
MIKAFVRADIQTDFLVIMGDGKLTVFMDLPLF